jgi:two-component system cell cycle sensor histidine kinase/response regulator CckA
MLCLIVDDDTAVRTFVRAIVRSEGYDTLEAGDGSHALELVRSLGGSVDLIITDIQMPGGDGLTLASRVGAFFPAVRIILMSGYTDLADGFNFVAKPFSWASMLSAVRRDLSPPLHAT